MISKQRDLTVNRLDEFFALPLCQVLGDLAFEACAAQHAVSPPAVEGSSVEALQAGAHAAQSAELLTTFGSDTLDIWTMEHFHHLLGLHLIQSKQNSSKQF